MFKKYKVELMSPAIMYCECCDAALQFGIGECTKCSAKIIYEVKRDRTITRFYRRSVAGYSTKPIDEERGEIYSNLIAQNWFIILIVSLPFILAIDKFSLQIMSLYSVENTTIISTMDMRTVVSMAVIVAIGIPIARVCVRQIHTRRGWVYRLRCKLIRELDKRIIA